MNKEFLIVPDGRFIFAVVQTPEEERIIDSKATAAPNHAASNPLSSVSNIGTSTLSTKSIDGATISEA